MGLRLQSEDLNLLNGIWAFQITADGLVFFCKITIQEIYPGNFVFCIFI